MRVRHEHALTPGLAFAGSVTKAQIREIARIQTQYLGKRLGEVRNGAMPGQGAQSVVVKRGALHRIQREAARVANAASATSSCQKASMPSPFTELASS